ncbi:MAG: endonuclease/exonuclease/phosphatase family protein [Planctomycetota bacterium]
MSTFRVASFNVENLFARPKVFNLQDKSVGDDLLKRIGEFRKVLKKPAYTDADKAFLVKEFQTGGEGPSGAPLRLYIRVREDRAKLWRRRSRKIVGVRAGGVGDIDVTVDFIKSRFDKVARKNTAKVITTVKADVACIVEADNRESLKRFDTDMLSSRYPYEMLLDGNDARGIDVGIYSKFPLGGIWTHMFDREGRSKTFSRDCPEYEVLLPSGERLYLLCNHLKSKGYGVQAKSNARRKRQAKAIAEILEGYDLKNDLVVVAGDLNDTPGSDPLSPLLGLSNLHDVLELQFPNDPGKRWTYHYRSFEQIDYLLVSTPLKERLKQAGVERRGIAKLEELTMASTKVPTEKEWGSVTKWTNQASDHGAVWADFEA